MCSRDRPNFVFDENAHCSKSVQIRCFFWSEYRKIRGWKNSVFVHFSRSVSKPNQLYFSKFALKCLIDICLLKIHPRYNLIEEKVRFYWRNVLQVAKLFPEKCYTRYFLLDKHFYLIFFTWHIFLPIFWLRKIKKRKKKTTSQNLGFAGKGFWNTMKTTVIQTVPNIFAYL